MMVSLPIGKALGNVEKMDDEFELVEIGDNALLFEFNGPEIRGRWGLVTTASSGEPFEGDPWGKNERCEAGTLRMSGIVSRDAVDDDDEPAF